MAGRVGESGLGDEGGRGVVELCLECRACKAECPVGVDVARFKGEFLADYFRRHGTPLRARAIGRIHTMSKWASRVAPFANAAARSSAGRWLGEALFGIDRRRTLPAWTRATFARQFHDPKRVAFRARPQRVDTARPVPSVILFNDTFTNYCHPEIGIAAADVLEAAGAAVRLVPHACCGRPLISQGLLEQARALAQANADALYHPAARRERILFLEPSLLSPLPEDARALGRCTPTLSWSPRACRAASRWRISRV